MTTNPDPAQGDPNDAPWFHTTPEAILRAESILSAFHENRSAHIGTVLAQDYSDDPPPGGPLAVLVALIVMADRLADYAAATTNQPHADLLRESARTVARAHYKRNNK